MEAIAFVLFLWLIAKLLMWLCEDNPSVYHKQQTSCTPLRGDLVKKLCPREEIYLINVIQDDKFGLLPYRIDGHSKFPPLPGKEYLYLVWVTKEEFDKHFEIK